MWQWNLVDKRKWLDGVREMGRKKISQTVVETLSVVEKVKPPYVWLKDEKLVEQHRRYNQDEWEAILSGGPDPFSQWKQLTREMCDDMKTSIVLAEFVEDIRLAGGKDDFTQRVADIVDLIRDEDYDMVDVHDVRNELDHLTDAIDLIENEIKSIHTDAIDCLSNEKTPDPVDILENVLEVAKDMASYVESFKDTAHRRIARIEKLVK
jgi:hypothetical protein